MRELTAAEMQQVNGGLGWAEGGTAIMALGFLSPVTAGFGFFIGMSMLAVDTMANGN